MTELPVYLGSVMEIFDKNGGKPFARFKTIDKLQGDKSPEMMAIIEFDNADTIHKMVQGEAFQGLKGLRAKVFDDLNMVISESM